MSTNIEAEELARLLGTIDTSEFSSIFMGETGDVIENLASPTSLPPTAVPAGPQPHSGGHQEWKTAGQYPAAQPTNLQYVYPAPYAAAASYLAVPQQTYNNLPVVEPSQQYLVPVGMINGAVVYELSAGYAPATTFAAPPPPNNKKRKREDQHDDRPYVKRPPNAFMLFLKDQRPNVMTEMGPGIKSAAVNALLGQRWKEMSNEQQATYFDQAHKEKKLHEQQHPDWTPNYGRKRKRDPKTDEAASTSTSAEVTQPPKKLCVTPTNMGVMGAPHTLTGVMEAPQTQTPVLLNVTDMAQLPDVYSQFADIIDSPTAGLLTESDDFDGVENLDQLLMNMFSPLPPSSEPQEEPQTSEIEHPQTEKSGVSNTMDMSELPDEFNTPAFPTGLFSLLDSDTAFESQFNEFDGVDTLNQLLAEAFGPLPLSSDLQADPQLEPQEQEVKRASPPAPCGQTVSLSHRTRQWHSSSSRRSHSRTHLPRH